MISYKSSIKEKHRPPNLQEVYFRATTSVCVKFLFYFSIKAYFFYFTRLLIQNTHIRPSIIHPFLFKYSFFIIIFTFIFSHTLSLILISLLFKVQTSDHHKTSLAEPPWLGLYFLHLLLSLFAVVATAYSMLSLLLFFSFFFSFFFNCATAIATASSS